VSKQPSAPGRASSSPFSRPVSFIRDLPIWTKLGLIMIVPTIATIIVGAAGLLDQVEQASNAERARSLTVLSGEAGNLVYALQDERAAAVKLLVAQSSTVEQARAEYAAAQKISDAAQANYRTTRAGVADVPAKLSDVLRTIETSLVELADRRTQVMTTSQVPLTVLKTGYDELIKNLLSIRDLAAQVTGETDLTDRMRAAAAVANAKEYVSQERVAVLEALGAKSLSTVTRNAYRSARESTALALGQFDTVAPDQVPLYQRTVSGAVMYRVVQLQSQLDTLEVNDNPNDVVNVADWETAMRGYADLINQVEVTLNQQAQQAAIDFGSQVQRRVLIETGVLLLTLLVGILFAWLVARSMARSLRDLRQGALAVAQYGLPQAVARLRDPALSSNLSPAGVALQIAEPLPVRSNDEFGQVTEAFNAVHLEAVRTAAEQAALRASVATMFVNLARRSQILVDRLIGHLDRLERGEQDPDRLSELFQLDHLATRMRRNDENLLVLAGADSTRIQREPAALMDVLRAAQSEVEHYTRVEFALVDQDIEIAAHAVNDLVHLIAELFDNATAFSPPDTSIRIEARRVGERAVLRVEDRGIGMSAEQYAELNERLATPPVVDVAVSRMMGLVVVARLAARHGVKVELSPAPQRGTIADVLLPSGVLVPRALSGRAQSPSGFPAFRAEDGAQPGARSPFGPPLELESGSAGPGGWDDGRGPVGAGPLAGFPSSYGPPPTPGYPPYGGTPAPSYGSPAPAFGGGPAPAPAPAPAYGSGGGAPGGFVGAGLGAALAGAGAVPPPAAYPPPTGNGRGRTPAWFDLTGATGPTHGPATSPAGAEPLPQRRPSGWGDPEPDPTFAPRQGGWSEPSTGPGAPTYGAPSSFGPPTGQAPAARPSAWPPVAGDGDARTPAPPSSYSNDLTMELPIFRELESAWFATGSQPVVPAAPSGSRPGTWPPEGTAAMGASSWTERGGGAEGSPRPAEGVSWRTAADEGWRAAQAAAQPQEAGTTDNGLPRRVPMAQLVPGGVESAAPTSSDRRTPDSVRGLLSAYHRGVQRGRGANGSFGTDPYLSGKEQEA